MAQAPYPLICHNNSVETREQHQPFIPWRHLSSKDYAQYIYKWCKIVKINQGDFNEWGNWGIQLDGAGNYSIVLEVVDDYVLVQGVELLGEIQALRPDTEPALVWSRYLRPVQKYEVPLIVRWTHFLDDQYIEVNYLRIEPATNNQDFDLIEGTFGNELANSNFHQILGARDYAKYLYKWGQLLKFGDGTITEVGNWGINQQIFNFADSVFIVLSVKTRYVLVSKAIMVEDGIATDPNFVPIWTWSRLLRLHTRLEFPRVSDWQHPWEPQRPPRPAFGYYQFKGPENKEE